MTRPAIEKELCKACGADVRAQADYCYNCGGAVSASAIAKKTSLPSGGNSLQEKIPVKKAETKIDNQEQTNLKSAASMRRNSKIIERKTPEIIWEEYDDAANGWFVSVAVALTILAIGILFLAIYLK